MKKWFCLLILLMGCGPQTPQDFAFEGRAKCRQLASILERIEGPDDFAIQKATLKKRFDEMSRLVERAGQFCEETGYARRGEINSDSEALLFQLKRIYQMPGGREFIESLYAQSF